MEPFWSSTGYFGTQLAGSLGVDFFYGQEIMSPELLLANVIGAAAATFATDKLMSGGAIVYFLDKDLQGRKTPPNLSKDLYTSIAIGVLGGTAVNVLVRKFVFAVPLYPALMAGAASAIFSWAVWVRPRMTSVTAGL